MSGNEMTPQTLRASGRHAHADAWEAEVATMSESWHSLSVAYNATCKRLEEAEKRIGALERWVDDLQSDMYINCVYCGHRYGPDDGITSTMRQVLELHIQNCPRHPLSRARTRIGALREALRMLSYSPDGLPDTWPTQEVVDAALQGEEAPHERAEGGGE